MNQTIDKLLIKDEIRFGGADTHKALIQKNRTQGRGELQIYSAGDAYGKGSKGAGIHLYSNEDRKHDGNIAFLTGPNNKGDGRMIISESGNISIGSGIWNYVDKHKEAGIFNIVKDGKTVFSINEDGMIVTSGSDKLEKKIIENAGQEARIKELEAKVAKMEKWLDSWSQK